MMDEWAPGILTLSVVVTARHDKDDPPDARYWCHPGCFGSRLAPDAQWDAEGLDE